VDVWANPKQFCLDDTLQMIDVAGCPPDAFSADGQLWGNPLFDWEKMDQDGYQWWILRVQRMFELFDVIRIDHFRGFDSYYAIPAGEETARNGVWREGPGMKLFRTLEEKLGKLHIIVEDLGYLTESVEQLLKDSGYPGMKLMQFAFDSGEDGPYLPHNYGKHCVVYTGTHDNDTILGWYDSLPEHTKQFATEYMRLNKEEGINWGMMKCAWASPANLSVVTMQDLLGLTDARMNTPAGAGGNWQWRALPGSYTKELAQKTAKYMRCYMR
jgi:4-alpha-glucanotransferase